MSRFKEKYIIEYLKQFTSNEIKHNIKFIWIKNHISIFYSRELKKIASFYSKNIYLVSICNIKILF